MQVSTFSIYSSGTGGTYVEDLLAVCVDNTPGRLVLGRYEVAIAMTLQMPRKLVYLKKECRNSMGRCDSCECRCMITSNLLVEHVLQPLSVNESSGFRSQHNRKQDSQRSLDDAR